VAERCPHDDSPYSCPPCLRSKAHPEFVTRPVTRLTSDATRLGARTNARFKSKCPTCRGLIAVSDLIVMSDEGWTHETCK
jgi:hypothetical protein